MGAVVGTLIREARCSMMISLSLFKYMILYGIVESAVDCIAFFVAHTNLSISQVTPVLLPRPDTSLVLCVVCLASYSP